MSKAILCPSLALAYHVEVGGLWASNGSDKDKGGMRVANGRYKISNLSTRVVLSVSLVGKGIKVAQKWSYAVLTALLPSVLLHNFLFPVRTK